MSSSEPADLGAFLTALEARGMADVLASGQHISKALQEVSSARREHARELMSQAALGHASPEVAVPVLMAIAGAKSTQLDLTPVWTMPGNEADVGHLMSQFYSLVKGARQSVTCATYNFEPTSQMWPVLRDASEQPGVQVTVYLDGDKADATKVKEQMPKATVFRSGILPNGKHVVSHAKFVIIDHELLLLTSANFSYSAENRNVELGFLVRDPATCRSIETTMASKRGVLYDLV